MNELQGLGWSPRWVSHLGCLKGCLDHLGVETSDGWLYGATGHAFVINIHNALCPSGPTAWKSEPIHRLGRNLGYTPHLVFGFKQEDSFRAKQQLAWGSVRSAIDEGVPCFGWELDIPEYYVVYGYNGAGYLYRGPGCDGGAGPKPWPSLGDSGIGVLEVYVIRPHAAADDTALVRDALRFAAQFGRDPSPWTLDGYAGGLGAYDACIAALESGSADGFGTAYNGAAWSECRTNAVGFLAEARKKVSGAGSSAFPAAQDSYGAVAESLKAVALEFPFVHSAGGECEDAMKANILDSARRERAIAALRAARAAEEAGLQALRAIVEALERASQ